MNRANRAELIREICRILNNEFETQEACDVQREIIEKYVDTTMICFNPTSYEMLSILSLKCHILVLFHLLCLVCDIFFVIIKQTQLQKQAAHFL